MTALQSKVALLEQHGWETGTGILWTRREINRVLTCLSKSDTPLSKAVVRSIKEKETYYFSEAWKIFCKEHPLAEFSILVVEAEKEP